MRKIYDCGRFGPRFSIIAGTLTAPEFIDVCKRLLHGQSGPSTGSLTATPGARSKAVREFAESTSGRIWLV